MIRCHPVIFQVGIFLKAFEDADLKHVSMTSWREVRPNRDSTFRLIALLLYKGGVPIGASLPVDLERLRAGIEFEFFDSPRAVRGTGNVPEPANGL